MYTILIAPVIDYLELTPLIPDVGEEMDFECETVENDPMMVVDENDLSRSVVSNSCDEEGGGVFLTCNQKIAKREI